MYDLVVIGGGGAGLTAALTANGFGKKVAIVEKRKLGGECTWSGCIPSKTLIKSAKIMWDCKSSEKYGLTVEERLLDEKVFEKISSVRESVYAHESPDKLRAIGIDVILGEGSFINENSIKVEDQVIESKKFILSIGTAPMVPAIEGIEDIDYLTNESIFELENIPDSLIIVGSGAIGVELAQAFNRLGTKVMLVHRREYLLKTEDIDVRKLITDKLCMEGVEVYSNKVPFKLINEGKKIIMKFTDEDQIVGDKILFATGRRIAYDGLKLENAGVKYSGKGIEVDNKLRSTNHKVYACGDCVGPYKFSHMAEYQGRIAAMNSIFPRILSKKIDYDVVPWVIFTDPEIAHVGKTVEEVEKSGISHKIFIEEFSELDRGVTDGVTSGFLKVILDRNNYILGAHIIGPRAGEIIHILVMMMNEGIKFTKLKDQIFAYPSYSDILRKMAKRVYLKEILNNPIVKILKKD